MNRLRKMSTDTIRLAISSLSKDGAIFLGLDNMYLVFRAGELGALQLYKIVTAHKDNRESPILRVDNIPKHVDGVIAACPGTGEVWVIPVADISSLTAVRLGKRWNIYKRTVQVLCSDEVDEESSELRQAATDAIDRMKGDKK